MAATSRRIGPPRETFDEEQSSSPRPLAARQTQKQTRKRTSRPFLAGKFRLRPDERWAIIGKSGTGKSVFARWIDYQYYLAHWPIVIVDPKKRYVDAALGDEYATAPDTTSIARPWRIHDGVFNPDARVQIYLPTFPALKDPVLDRLLFSLLERGGVVLHIEDMTQVANESAAPPGLQALMTDGRTAEVVMLLLAQRPVGIPRNMVDQAENFVAFRMPDIDDRIRMSKILGDKRVETQILPKRYFWYLHEGDDYPTKYSPLPLSEVAKLGGIRAEDKRGGSSESRATA